MDKCSTMELYDDANVKNTDAADDADTKASTRGADDLMPVLPPFGRRCHFTGGNDLDPKYKLNKTSGDVCKHCHIRLLQTQ